MSDSTSGTPVSVTSEDGGFTVTSTSETAEQITESLKPEPAPAADEGAAEEKPTDPKLAKAASKLGKAGGEAAAAKRAEAKAAQEAEVDADLEPTKDEEPEKLGKPRHDAKARMLEATRKEAEAKREAAKDRDRADQAERRLAEAERRAAPAKEPAKPTEGDPEPQEPDFDDYKDFVKAAARWGARQEWNERQKEASERAQFTARHDGINRAVQTFQGRMSETAKADATFKERTADLAATLQPSFTLARGERVGPLNVAADEIINSEHAPALMLHFSEHPEDLQRLSVLRTPADVQVEVRFIAKGLAAAPTATAPKAEVSQARPPVRPVTGSPHTADSVPGEGAPYEDHKRYWSRKDRERQALR